MYKKNNIIPFATVQIDVDNLWCYLEDFGISDSTVDVSIVYEYCIKHFLDLFDRYNIKATFFCIGKDALNKNVQIILKEIVRQGHEVANHTMSHPQNFSVLSIEQKEKEILESDKILRIATDTCITGFKSPGWFFDKNTIKILKAHNYTYDSSILPTFFSSFIMFGRYILSGGVRTGKTIGGLSNALSPMSPYFPCERFHFLKDKNNSNFIELPNSTIPVIRFPFHSTFVFIFGEKLFDFGIYRWNMNIPLNYVFHAIDLLPDNIEKRLIKNPTLRMSIKRRSNIVENIIKRLAEKFCILPSNKLAIKFMSMT